MIDRRYRVGDGILILVAVGILALTFHDYQSFVAVSDTIELMPGSSPVAAAARIESIKAYLLTHPDDYNAWENLAVACYDKGPDAFADGLNALDKARKLGATGEALFWYAGVMFQGVGLPDYAIPELERYRRHHPNHRETRARLANLYLQIKKDDDALALYQDLRRENPKDPVILYNYAVVAKEKGLWQDAYDALSALRQVGQPVPDTAAALEKEIQTHIVENNGKKS